MVISGNSTGKYSSTIEGVRKTFLDPFLAVR